MLKQRSPLLLNDNPEFYRLYYQEVERLLFNLLDTPVSAVHHIGSTALSNALTSHCVDVLVTVPNLHAMTTLDEKRLNNSGFYRLHHPYSKKCVFSHFTDLKTLNEQCRLHIMEAGSDKAERYITAHQALTDNPELLSAFNTFKSRLTTSSKQDYEEKKSTWFSSVIAN